MAQQLGAPGRIHRNGPLGDVGCSLGLGAHFDAQRRVQQRIGQRLHRRRERGREKQVLPPGGQQAGDVGPFVGKAHVQQAVGFVQHQRADARQREGVAVQQIQQAARRGHHHIGAAAQAHHLRVDGHAAEHHRHLHGLGQAVGHIAEGGPHLHRQLARGHQHQHLGGARRGNYARRAQQSRACTGGGRCLAVGIGQLLQQGQGKGRCFA